MQTSSSVFQVPITDSAPPSLEHVTIFGPQNLICPIHEPFPLGHRLNPISFDESIEDKDEDEKKEGSEKEEVSLPPALEPPTFEVVSETPEGCVSSCYSFALGHSRNPITILSDDDEK